MRPPPELPSIEARQSLITDALLGTDRRPAGHPYGPGLEPPAEPSAADPVTALLDRAAAARAAVQAGSPLPWCPAPALAPADRLPAAPVQAQDLLGRLLDRPESALVNSWLAMCVERGTGVSPEHWPRLADLAARSGGYDRPLLRQAIGERGCWLLDQNPRWSHVAADGPGTTSSGPAGVSQPVAVGPESTAQALQRLCGWPGRSGPGQWEHALDLVVGGGLGERTQELARLVALGVPLDVGRVLLDRLVSLEHHPGTRVPGPAQPASHLVVERSLLLLRRLLSTRVEILDAFAETASETPGKSDQAGSGIPAITSSPTTPAVPTSPPA